MLGRLYAKWGMDDDTDFQPLSPRIIQSSPTSMT